MRTGLLVAGAALGLGAFTAGTDPPDPPAPTDSFHFTYDLLPLLQRQGCSAAPCHGGATGRGGFKLSLFGSDPAADWAAIALDRDGRRLDLLDPENSLLLRKPSLALEHGGGLRLGRQSAAYARLRDWIGNGAPFVRGQPAEPTALELRAAQPGGARLRAVALFAGDLEHDVTELTTFRSSDERVVLVDTAGHLERAGPGEAWVLARFANLGARRRVVHPFGAGSPRESDEGVPSHPVDRVWNDSLRELGLAPYRRTDDARLARRLWLDLAGRLPTLAEQRAFHALTGTDRVPATVDRLLAADEFARVFGAHLARMFEIDDPMDEPARDRPRNARLRGELADAVRDGVPVDRLADTLLGQGNPLVQRFGDPRDRAEFVGRAFLGIRIGCARCHDHPLDRWRQREHLAFSAMFADPRPGPEGGMVPGMLFEPDSGALVEPRLLPLCVDAPDGTLERRQQVSWLVRDEGHRMLARNVANRVFALLLGRGLCEPVDDQRPSNPALHGDLLETLTDRFVASGYDLRSLVRLIATSDLYAVTSEPRGQDTADDARPVDVGADDEQLAHYLARRTARPMPFDLLRHCIAKALGVPAKPATDAARSPLAARLWLLNGEFLPDLLARGGTTVDALADFVADDRQRLDELFETILTRKPTAAERARFLAEITPPDGARQALRSLAFALFCSREFASIR